MLDPPASTCFCCLVFGAWCFMALITRRDPTRHDTHPPAIHHSHKTHLQSLRSPREQNSKCIKLSLHATKQRNNSWSAGSWLKDASTANSLTGRIPHQVIWQPGSPVCCSFAHAHFAFAARAQAGRGNWLNDEQSKPCALCT